MVTNEIGRIIILPNSFFWSRCCYIIKKNSHDVTKLFVL